VLSVASRAVAAGGGEIPETPRTAAIEIQRLYEDFRAMAERIERRSGYLRDFAAAVSHEFKTPLAGIAGAVELLEDHYPSMSNDERRRFLSNISADTARLSQLVRRLLDLARADMATPESGAATAIAEPARRLADAPSAEGFKVNVELAPNLPEVSVPTASLETLLSILIENSRQAGASAVTIAGRRDGDDVILSISDDGPGIAPADLARVFEPFFTGRRAEGGTGLGLPIARSLLAAARGEIVAIQADTGARFDVRLPVAS